MSDCVKCGKANREGIKFCSGCGSPMEAVSKPANACASCGKENREGVKFCSTCGKPIGLSESSKVPVPPIPEIPKTPIPVPEPAPPIPEIPKTAVSVPKPVQPIPEIPKTPIQVPKTVPPIPVIATVPVPDPAPVSAEPSLIQPERLSPPASPEPPEPTEPTESASNKKQLVMWIVAAVLALVVIALSWYVYRNWQASRQPAELTQPEVPMSEMQQAAPIPEPDVQPNSQVIQPEPVEASPTAVRPQKPSFVTPRTVSGSVRTQPANSSSATDSPTRASEAEVSPKYESAPDPFTQWKQDEKAPKYEGAVSGIMTWSGLLKKGATVVISGAAASRGSLSGALPGMPVIIEVEPRDIGIAEAPAPSSGWSRMVLRANKDAHKTISIRWKVYR